MDEIQSEVLTVAPVPTADRPAWQKPELIEVPIKEVTASPYAYPGNDGTPSVTTIS